jgi:hypothetical protein
MDNSMKKEMLEYINEFGENSDFWGRDNDSRNELGSNNLRALAVMAENADCFEELELFIQYKMARGNGWKKILRDGKPFGEIVIGHIKKIYEKSMKNNEDESNAMKNIGLYFGYLYWKRRTLN